MLPNIGSTENLTADVKGTSTIESLKSGVKNHIYQCPCSQARKEGKYLAKLIMTCTENGDTIYAVGRRKLSGTWTRSTSLYLIAQIIIEESCFCHGLGIIWRDTGIHWMPARFLDLSHQLSDCCLNSAIVVDVTPADYRCTCYLCVDSLVQKMISLSVMLYILCLGHFLKNQSSPLLPYKILSSTNKSRGLTVWCLQTEDGSTENGSTKSSPMAVVEMNKTLSRLGSRIHRHTDDIQVSISLGYKGYGV